MFAMAVLASCGSDATYEKVGLKPKPTKQEVDVAQCTHKLGVRLGGYVSLDELPESVWGDSEKSGKCVEIVNCLWGKKAGSTTPTEWDQIRHQLTGATLQGGYITSDDKANLKACDVSVIVGARAPLAVHATVNDGSAIGSFEGEVTVTFGGQTPPYLVTPYRYGVAIAHEAQQTGSTETGSSLTVRFLSLPPGDYTFKVAPILSGEDDLGTAAESNTVTVP